MNSEDKYIKTATELGKLVSEKNSSYGNSFKDSEYFLKLLFPTGIPVEKYRDILLIVRVFDKMKRIATRKDAFGENPWSDINGYALLGTVNDEEEARNEDVGNQQSVDARKFCTLHPSWLLLGKELFCPQCYLNIVKYFI
jgi:hypothetical protein